MREVDLECGIWKEGIQTWNMEYEMRGVGIGCVIWDLR